MKRIAITILVSFVGLNISARAQDPTPADEVVTALEKGFAVIGQSLKPIDDFFAFQKQDFIAPSVAYQNALTRSYHIASQHADDKTWATLAMEMEKTADAFETLMEEFQEWSRESGKALEPTSGAIKKANTDLSNILTRFKNEGADLSREAASAYLKEISPISQELKKILPEAKRVGKDIRARAQSLKLSPRVKEFNRAQEKIDLRVLQSLADLKDEEPYVATCSCTCEVGVNVDNHRFPVLSSEVSLTHKNVFTAVSQLDSICSDKLKQTTAKDKNAIRDIGLKEGTVPNKLALVQFENFYTVFELAPGDNGAQRTLPTLTGSCRLKAAPK